MKVLVIEDDPEVISAYQDIVEDMPWAIDFFTDPRAALRQFRAQGRYDLVVTDLRMPIKDGPSVIGEIKRINPEQRIVVLSGFLSSWKISKNEQIQCFEKPVSLAEVIRNASVKI